VFRGIWRFLRLAAIWDSAHDYLVFLISVNVNYITDSVFSLQAETPGPREAGRTGYRSQRDARQV